MFRPMIRFDVFTEDTNRATIELAARQRFDGYTITVGAGYYGGQPEPSLCVSVVAEVAQRAALRDRAIAFARWINCANNQHSVLITETEVTGAFILTRSADC